jgi:DNA-binding winged helix-turn-helix (wHTH) protein/TolB-like protein/Tfp pilus assembly protein PilF
MSANLLSSRELYAFADYRLDATGRTLFRRGEGVPLPPKQIDTLIVLVRARGAVVERDRLVSEVWPDTFVEDGALSRNISLLRKALEEDSDGQGFIETLPKRGYRFVPPVTKVIEETPTTAVLQRHVAITVVDEVETTHTLGARQLPGRVQRSPVALLAALALGLFVIAATVILWRQAGVNRAAGLAVRTMAVLPFRQVGVESSEDYLGFGLADVLTTRFSNLASLSVVPSGRSAAFKGREPIEAGRALEVDAVLDGTIRKQDDRYRVTVQLLSVSAGHVLWAGTFEETGADLLMFEGRIADSVASLLAPRLAPEERARVARQSTQNSDAWRAYLRGRAVWVSRAPADLERSIAHFEDAVVSDPGFALAHAGLAQALVVQGSWQYRWPVEVFPRARLAAIRAIELDGALADAHGALAEVAWVFDRDWRTAEQEFNRALQLNPLDATLHHWYASYLTAMGRFDEALAAIDRAIALDPGAFPANYEKIRTYFYSGRFDESIQQAERVASIPGSAFAAALLTSLAHDLQGHSRESIDALQRAQLEGPKVPAVMAFTARYAGRDGRRAEALVLIRQLEAQRAVEYVDPIFIAGAYLGLDDRDNALKWLKQTVDDRSMYASYLAVDPVYAVLHKDPRFREVVRSAGLAEVLPR